MVIEDYLKEFEDRFDDFFEFRDEDDVEYYMENIPGALQEVATMSTESLQLPAKNLLAVVVEVSTILVKDFKKLELLCSFHDALFVQSNNESVQVEFAELLFEHEFISELGIAFRITKEHTLESIKLMLINILAFNSCTKSLEGDLKEFCRSVNEKLQLYTGPNLKVEAYVVLEIMEITKNVLKKDTTLGTTFLVLLNLITDNKSFVERIVAILWMKMQSLPRGSPGINTLWFKMLKMVLHQNQDIQPIQSLISLFVILQKKNLLNAELILEILQIHQEFLLIGHQKDLLGAIIIDAELSDMISYQFVLESFKLTDSMEILCDESRLTASLMCTQQFNLLNFFLMKTRTFLCFLELCLYVIPSAEDDYLKTFVQNVARNVIPTSMKHLYMTNSQLNLEKSKVVKRMVNIPEHDIIELHGVIKRSRNKTQPKVVKECPGAVASETPTKAAVQQEHLDDVNDEADKPGNIHVLQCESKLLKGSQRSFLEALAAMYHKRPFRVQVGATKIRYSWVVKNYTAFSWPKDCALFYINEQNIENSIGFTSCSIEPVEAHSTGVIHATFHTPNIQGQHFLFFRLFHIDEQTKNPIFSFGEPFVADIFVVRKHRLRKKQDNLRMFNSCFSPDDDLLPFDKLMLHERLRTQKLKRALIETTAMSKFYPISAGKIQVVSDNKTAIVKDKDQIECELIIDQRFNPPLGTHLVLSPIRTDQLIPTYADINFANEKDGIKLKISLQNNQARKSGISGFLLCSRTSGSSLAQRISNPINFKCSQPLKLKRRPQKYRGKPHSR